MLQRDAPTGVISLSLETFRQVFGDIDPASDIGWFLERLRRRTVVEGECWVWQGWTKNGYPSLSLHNRDTYAHRLVCDLVHGIPGGQEACHSCDVPACWNPDHLFPGTHAENVADCIAKQRNSSPPTATGEKNHKAWLTDAQVLDIRTAWESADRPQQRELAAAYGCSQSTIWRIVHGKVRSC